MRTAVFFIVLLASVGPRARAADQEVEDLLTQMRKAYREMKSAKLILTSTLADFKKNRKFEIKVSYKKREKIRAEVAGYDDKKPVVFLCDGLKMVAKGAPFLDEPTPFQLGPMLNLVPVNLETICLWDYNRQLSTEPGHNMSTSDLTVKKDQSWRGASWVVLEEIARPQGIKVRYYVDPSDFLIYRTQVKDLEDTKISMDVEVVSLEKNPDLDDCLFKLESGSTSSAGLSALNSARLGFPFTLCGAQPASVVHRAGKEPSSWFWSMLGPR